MLFNKTISALIACGVVGTSFITPTSSHAISLPESQSETISRRENSWIANGYSGYASWYGPGLYGNPTANGETLRHRALTAAHRTLPFGTLVRVTNLRNGRSVVVRINDRGPYSHADLDLSYAAFAHIQSVSKGNAVVCWRVVG